MFVLMVSVITNVYARDCQVEGLVLDKLSGGHLYGTLIELVNSETDSVISQNQGGLHIINGDEESYVGNFRIMVPGDGKEYNLRISKDGYDPDMVMLTPEMLKKQRYDVGKVYLSRVSKQLEEVTVTATKVKFYNRGDTVVYNADAFITADGSMLDALIRQLPGVELHSDGRIFVNGRFVDNLMLNGKDFFKNDRQVMLDNIGAYTVKNIEVYDKLSDRDAFVGGEPTGNLEYVMDVKLKKDYMDNWLVNLMGGYGTSDRYIGRLYAQRFTPRSSVAIYGNANNTNESREPGESIIDWNPQSIGTGTKEQLKAGVNYNWKSYNNIWSLKGDANVTYTDSKDRTSISRTNFLDKGFTYDYSDNSLRQRNLTLWAYQEVVMEKKPFRLWIAPRWYYNKWNSNGEDVSASFNRELIDWSADFIKTIYEKGESATKSIINRNISNDKWRGHYTNGGVHMAATYVVPNTFNAFDLTVKAMGDRTHETHWNDYKLQFGETGRTGSESHRRFENYPTGGWNLDATLTYSHNFGRGLSAVIGYQFVYDRHKNTSLLYAMTKEYSETQTLLPSITENGNEVYANADADMNMAMDNANSYNYIHRKAQHNIIPVFRFNKKNFMLTVPLPFGISTENLEYHRGGKNISKRRTAWVVEGSIDNCFMVWTFGRFRFGVFPRYTHTQPSLLYMIDITDTTDPLVVTKGNENLKAQDNFSGSASLTFSKSSARLTTTIGGNWDVTWNAVARGMSYDYATGVRTYTYHNVNGNRSGSVYNNTSWSFGPRKCFTIGNNISGNFAQSVDVMGSNNQTYLSTVLKKGVSERLSFSWQWSGQRIGLVGNVNHSRFTGSEKDFTPFYATEFNYGINGVFRLPANFGISTDFMVYSRRGYEDSALNTNNFVWNGRITYSMLKGSLVASIDGYDILHNLSNVFYSVNAQGRTETYRAVLPRYVMFTLQWRFSTLDKKKK